MGYDPKPVLTRDLRLPRLNLLVLELKDVAARSTDQMIVVLLPHLSRLVSRLAVAELALLRDPSVYQELHGAVDSRVAEAWHRRLNQSENLIEREVNVAGEERIYDGVTLTCAL